MSRQFPHPFNKLVKKYVSYRKKLPAQVSAIALAEFKENFRRQGYRDDSGRTVKWKARKVNRGRRNKTRNILVQSGRLRRSLTMKPTNTEARVVASGIPYAQRHNEGYKTTPPRPFMITTKPLLDDIEEHVFDELEKIWKSL